MQVTIVPFAFSVQKQRVLVSLKNHASACSALFHLVAQELQSYSGSTMLDPNQVMVPDPHSLKEIFTMTFCRLNSD